MPYYMDFHIFDQVTVDEVKQAHVADKSVQNRYGVKYLQFWVNVDMGSVFCLMEGPNAEACAQVHREAHGNVACNISEVQKGFYEQFMGGRHLLDKGLVLKPNGKVDSGQRFLLTVDLIYRTNASHPGDVGKLKYQKTGAIIDQSIGEFVGSRIRNEWDDSVLAVFDDEEYVLRCAIELKSLLNTPDASVSFKIGVSSGQPMSAQQGFFEESLREAQLLNTLAMDGEVVIDLRPCRDSNLWEQVASESGVRIVSEGQKSFVKAFFKLIDAHLNDPAFSVNFITSQMGVSRPQFYRKICEITGRSPNQFIRDIRLRRALKLLLKNRYSVSEIAYDVGFGTPSYFAKRFHEKYGVYPSKVAG